MPVSVVDGDGWWMIVIGCVRIVVIVCCWC